MMEGNGAKFNKWFEKYTPKCVICGNGQWDTISGGVAFQKPGDLNQQLVVTAIKCKECGNLLIVNKEF